MKFFTNKKIMQKMTIVLVILMLFNFITPNYVRATDDEENIGTLLVTGIQYFSLWVGDALINVMQEIFIGTSAIFTAEEQMRLDGYMDVKTMLLVNTADAIDNAKWYHVVLSAIMPGWVGIKELGDDISVAKEKQNNYQDKYEIAISPWKIFSGKIYALDIDFISSNNTTSTDEDEDEKKPAWYIKYETALTKIKNKIDELSNNPEQNENEIFGYTYVYIMAGGNELKEIEVINKIKVWYGEMDGTFNNAKFESVIAPESTFSHNEENKQKREAIIRALQESGIEDAVKEAGQVIDSSTSWAASEENAPVNVLHNIIATWYKILRNIALIVMLCMLVYVGIRIMITSTAADGAKYKKMLMDWAVALCILFVLHYIMAFTINISQVVTEAFLNNDVNITTTDDILNTIREKAATTSGEGVKISIRFGYVILYLVLIVYTVYFLFYYVKRVVYSAFLTLIAPLVAITYPLDKMGDSKSQAFNMWLQEYIMNVIIQPVHLLIYTVMVTSAMSLAVNNPIYAIVVIGAMIPAEKFIKEMFGLGSKKGPAGGLLAGAAAMGAIQKLANKKPPQFGHHSGGNEKGGADKSQEKTKKPKMAQDKISEYSKYITDDLKGEDPDNIIDNGKDEENKSNIIDPKIFDDMDTQNGFSFRLSLR